MTAGHESGHSAWGGLTESKAAPDVSVVITTYHREQWVADAIASARHQEGLMAEVIVADDSPEGSARRAVESLQDDAVRYFHQAPVSGGRPGLVRNRAVLLCKAPLVHFLDDDDLLLPGALAALAGVLREGRAGMAFGRVVPFGEGPAVAQQAAYFRRVGDAARHTRGKRLFAAQLMFGDALFVNSACMVRRDVFAGSGGYDERLRCCEDIELFLRIGREHGACFVDRDVLLYRVGFPSIMSDLRDRAAHAVMADAYRTMGRRYRALFGAVEFHALRALAKAGGRLLFAREKRANGSGAAPTIARPHASGG